MHYLLSLYSREKQRDLVDIERLASLTSLERSNAFYLNLYFLVTSDPLSTGHKDRSNNIAT